MVSDINPAERKNRNKEAETNTEFQNKRSHNKNINQILCFFHQRKNLMYETESLLLDHHQGKSHLSWCKFQVIHRAALRRLSVSVAAVSHVNRQVIWGIVALRHDQWQEAAAIRGGDGGSHILTCEDVMMWDCGGEIGYQKCITCRYRRGLVECVREI